MGVASGWGGCDDDRWVGVVVAVVGVVFVRRAEDLEVEVEGLLEWSNPGCDMRIIMVRMISLSLLSLLSLSLSSLSHVCSVYLNRW